MHSSVFLWASCLALVSATNSDGNASPGDRRVLAVEDSASLLQLNAIGESETKGEVVVQAIGESEEKDDEDQRANYLESHRHMVAVFPGVISRDNAAKLHEAVDRRWRNVKKSYLKRLIAKGGDGDNLVDSVDRTASYAADILGSGECLADPEDEDDEFMVQEDCDLAEKLLEKHVTPLMEQKMKEWNLGNSSLYPCDSFVKRYMPGERHELHPHRDMTSLLTANVLLSDPNDFKGGLIMYPEADALQHQTEDELRGYLEEDHMGQGVFLEHSKGVDIGELVLHRGSTWHGVQMLETEKSRRYSWITWYSPTKDCEYNWRGKL